MSESCIVEAGDITIRQGNNFPPIKWQFLNSENPDVLFPIDGSQFNLEIEWPGGSLSKVTGTDPDLVMDTVRSTVTWTPIIEETRTMPVGRIAEYELERWIGGTQQTWVIARVIVEEGLNID